jgi:HEAT repeat protein
MLVSDEVLMEWKHEIVLDDLAPDPSDAATTLLILATTNPSVPISMASLMALSDRVDDRVEQQLIRLLRDPSWKRRAWSARILGQTGRRDALGTLTEILGSESDTRVRRQLEQAIAALQAPSPAAEAAEGAEGAASGGAGG